MSVSIASNTPETVTFRGVDGLSLIADEWNRGAASAEAHPSILMLHGGGQNRYSWKNTGQILADGGFHVIAMDSRGHGDSDRSPTANYSVESLCTDTLQVLYQIDRPVALIAISRRPKRACATSSATSIRTNSNV